MKRIDYSRKPDLFSLKEREEKDQATETHEKWAAKYKENKIKRERKNAEDYQIHGLILDVFKAHRAVPFHGDRRFSVSPQVREREREKTRKRDAEEEEEEEKVEEQGKGARNDTTRRPLYIVEFLSDPPIMPLCGVRLTDFVPAGSPQSPLYYTAVRWNRSRCR